MILPLQLEELNKFDAVKEKITELKKTEKNVIYGTPHHANPLLKSETWPKCKRTNDNIHPMTYLKTILRLSEDIPDSKTALNSSHCR